LNKPFKELTKEERVIVARARSRAMRAKAGVPVASKTDGAPAAAEAAEQVVEEEVPAAVAATEAVAADPMADVPAALLNKPFKELTKEERVIVARARSRAMRAKAGLPVASNADGAPAAAKAAAVSEPSEPEEEEVPAVVAATEAVAADTGADVPAELLNKPFKELTKEERIIVARARSRAVRARAGKPVGDADA
jgi:hypothetical protein